MSSLMSPKSVVDIISYGAEMRRRIKGSTSEQGERKHYKSSTSTKIKYTPFQRVYTIALFFTIGVLGQLYSILYRPSADHASTKHIDSSLARSNLREIKVKTDAKPQLVPDLPNVLLLELGTDSVSNWLYEAGACHAKIFEGEPEYFEKQVQFFNQDDRYNRGINFYKRRFQHCFAQGAAADITFDATPNYMVHPDRVFKIYNQAAGDDAASHLKVIFVLREPVEREWVNYNKKANDYHLSSDKKNGWFADTVEGDGSLMSFERYSGVLRFFIKDKADYYTDGLYAMHLKEWARFFERNQLLVLSYDELQSDPTQTQRRIQQFLDKEYELQLVGYDTEKAEGLTKRAAEILEPLFRKSNEELYFFLSRNPGPSMEQRPFARFAQRTAVKIRTWLELPNVLMIGTQKAGTSALSNWLFSNGVCNPEKQEGEPFFYSKEAQFFNKDERYHQGIEFYAKRFENCYEENVGELRLDATPDNMLYPDRVHKIYSEPAAGDMLSKLKLITVLREPIDRELSAYNHKVFDYKASGDTGWRNGTWYRNVVRISDGSVKSFSEYSAFVKEAMDRGIHDFSYSRYVEHLKRWTSYFDRKQLLVLSYDDLLSNPSAIQTMIEKFLGTKMLGDLAKTNDSGISSKVKDVPEDAVKILGPVFHDLNLELYDFLRNHPGPPMERPFPPFKEHFFNDTVTSAVAK